MTLRRVTLTACLASALSWSLATAAPPKPAPTLSSGEQLCQALGEFAYNRALERDGGAGYLEILAQVRGYDAAKGVLPAIRQLHEEITRAVFSTPGVSPERALQGAEMDCVRALPGKK